MKTYKVVGEHKDYRIGAYVQFTDEDAKKLVAQGVIVVDDVQPKTKQTKQATTPTA